MQRMTRSRTRQQAKSKLDSISRKIRDMSPTKKQKLKRVIAKYNKTKKEINEKKMKRIKLLKSIKKKHGTYARSYYDLEKKTTPYVADKILKMVKNLETYERRLKNDIKKADKDKNRLKRKLLKIDEDLKKNRDLVLLYNDPNAMRTKISPEILEHLTSTKLDTLIQELNDEHLKLKQKESTIQKELTILEKKFISK